MQPSDSPQASDSAPPQNSPRSRRLCRVGLGIAAGLALALVISIETTVDPEVRQRLVTGLGPVLWLIPAVLGLLGLFVWVLFCSRISRRTRIRLGGSALVVMGLAVSLLRIDGFSGDMYPQFVWRWAPAPRRGFSPHSDSQAASVADDNSSDPVTESETDYPGFLGRDRTGMVGNVRLARDWKARPPRELWRHDVGPGWSSFAVVGDYAVTQEQRDSQECVVCYDLRTGQQRWVHQDETLFTGPGVHGDGPRATPTIHRGRVYALGGTGYLNCLDLRSGAQRWQQKLLPNPATDNLQWGMSGSPLIVGKHVVVAPGVRPAGSVMAFQQDSGELAWSVGEDPAAYASPQLVTLEGQSEILVFNGAGLSAHDPANGGVLWSFPWVTQSVSMVNVAQPVVLRGAAAGVPDEAVLISSGYGQGSALLTVTKKKPAEWVVDKVWHNTQLKSKFSNVICVGGFVYGLDEGILVCLDAGAGTRRWKGGRYGHGQLLLAGDLLLVQCESGEIALVDPSPEGFRELGRCSALSTKTWNHPALTGDLLLVRNDREAACYELPLATD